MLHTVAQLTKDILRNIGRTLGDEVDAHALGTYQTDYLFDLVEQGLGCAIEQHVGLVEEEHKLWQLHIAHLGQGRVEL